jgi:hypothetical protein
MKQTYTGGCHCGAVRYEADVDLSQGTLRCNCSICTKARAWLVSVNGPDFRLLKGEDVLSQYNFNSNRINHMFCKNCGIKSFAYMGTPNDRKFVAAVVSCLDNISDAELAKLPITYVDGRHDNFKSPPAETQHL